MIVHTVRRQRQNVGFMAPFIFVHGVSGVGMSHQHAPLAPKVPVPHAGGTRRWDVSLAHGVSWYLRLAPCLITDGQVFVR